MQAHQLYIYQTYTQMHLQYIHVHHRHHCRYGASTYMYLCTHTNHNGLMYATLYVTIDCTHEHNCFKIKLSMYTAILLTAR